MSESKDKSQTRIKASVSLPPQHTTFADYQRAWLRADELGVDTIFNWDHFFPLFGEKDGPHFEAWTLLTALGVQTKRAQIGCLVLSMSYRNPALLSAMAKTLDHATNGRLILGVGAGWAERDYDEYGYEFGTAGDRLRNLERGLKIIKERWERDNPPPLNGTIPILIGGSGEKVTLRITAQYADLWNGGGEPADYRHKIEVLDQWCAKVGRDPAAIERTASVGTDLSKADDMIAAGASHIIFSFRAPFEDREIEELVAWRDRRNG